ncbi:hypothetical protein E2C01_078736 [Portunus trituberculatus]|uniref:Uncharacterized protein n=1 Tax=Portunus trituberculatus TaxID=210409 RepID=A0A5B7IJL2_PORTR|nr:hypothetical protein [Portunus trituberculatus]
MNWPCQCGFSNECLFLVHGRTPYWLTPTDDVLPQTRCHYFDKVFYLFIYLLITSIISIYFLCNASPSPLVYFSNSKLTFI